MEAAPSKLAQNELRWQLCRSYKHGAVCEIQGHLCPFWTTTPSQSSSPTEWSCFSTPKSSPFSGRSDSSSNARWRLPSSLQNSVYGELIGEGSRGLEQIQIEKSISDYSGFETESDRVASQHVNLGGFNGRTSIDCSVSESCSLASDSFREPTVGFWHERNVRNWSAIIDNDGGGGLLEENASAVLFDDNAPSSAQLWCDGELGQADETDSVVIFGEIKTRVASDQICRPNKPGLDALAACMEFSKKCNDGDAGAAFVEEGVKSSKEAPNWGTSAKEPSLRKHVGLCNGYHNNVKQLSEEACLAAKSQQVRRVKHPSRQYGYSLHVKNISPSSPLRGYVRFFESGGRPCFSFFVMNSDEALFARAYRQGEQHGVKNCDWMYIFHSRNVNGKPGLESGRVGKMALASKISKCRRETQCVLFDEKVTEQSAAIQRVKERPDSKFSRSVVGASSLAVEVPYMPSQRIQVQCDASNKAIHTKNQFHCHEGTGKNRPCRVEQNGGSCVELAAILISMFVPKRDGEQVQNDVAGWGVKFLGKGSESGWGLKFLNEPLLNSEDCKKASSLSHYAGRSFVSAEKKSKHGETMMVNVTLVVPSGIHGLPSHGLGQLTPLLERFHCGGQCDCGGWDEGCGICVLKAEPIAIFSPGTHIALTLPDCLTWVSPGRPLKVFTQVLSLRCYLMHSLIEARLFKQSTILCSFLVDTVQGLTRWNVLTLDVLDAGVFSLCFHSCLSSLQAFAAAVAMLHQQVMQT